MFARIETGVIAEKFTGRSFVYNGFTNPASNLDVWEQSGNPPADIVRITRDAEPVYDPATQKLQLNEPGIGDAPVETWTVVDLTQTEIDAKKPENVLEKRFSDKDWQALFAVLEDNMPMPPGQFMKDWKIKRAALG